MYVKRLLWAKPIIGAAYVKPIKDKGVGLNGATVHVSFPPVFYLHLQRKYLHRHGLN